jgi:hypothetical protein
MATASEGSKHERLRVKTLAALTFVALVWVLTTLAGLSRARAVGWPACITDEGVLAMMWISLAILAGLVIFCGQLLGFGARQSSSPPEVSPPLATLVPHRGGSGFAVIALGMPVIAGVVLLFVAGFFAVGPIRRSIFLPAGPPASPPHRPYDVRPLPAELPSCTSQEVVRAVEQLLRGTDLGPAARSIAGHREIRFDSEANRRLGQCVVRTEGGDIWLNYVVEWHDRGAGQFMVRLPPAELPSCTDQDIVEMLEELIRGTPAGASVTSIDSHREIFFDAAANRRRGRCVVHTADQDIEVNYFVEWQDRDSGQVAVQIE